MIERVVRLMEYKGVNAAQLTRELELSNSAITDWKKGKARPSIDAIIKLSDYFNVSTDYLLKGIQTEEVNAVVLSENEKKLVNIYRSLDEGGKHIVMGHALNEQSRVEGKSYKEEYGQEIS